jgi:hypothetical protein
VEPPWFTQIRAVPIDKLLAGRHDAENELRAEVNSDFARNVPDRSGVFPSLSFDRHSEPRLIAHGDRSFAWSDRVFQHQRPVPFIEPLTALLYRNVGDAVVK